MANAIEGRSRARDYESSKSKGWIARRRQTRLCFFSRGVRGKSENGGCRRWRFAQFVSGNRMLRGRKGKASTSPDGVFVFSYVFARERITVGEGAVRNVLRTGIFKTASWNVRHCPLFCHWTFRNISFAASKGKIAEFSIQFPAKDLNWTVLNSFQIWW